MEKFKPVNYSYKTRIGNWSQEWELEQVKKKDYKRRAQSEFSRAKLIQSILLKSYQPASLSLSKDGYLHFGDHIMFYNGKTEGFLAADISQKLFTTQQNYYASTVYNLHACARSVFIIERHNPKDNFNDNIVHYGQQFKIRLNPLLVSKDKFIYLHSLYTNQIKYSPVCRNQQVTWKLDESYNVVWCFQSVSPDVRFEMQDEPVRCNDNVLIKHLFTNQWLASDTNKFETNLYKKLEKKQDLIAKKKIKKQIAKQFKDHKIENTFGQQYQVMVNNFYVKSKTQGLKKQQKGQITGDIPLRGQTLENLWVIVNARVSSPNKDPSQHFDQSFIAAKKIEKIPLIQKIKALLAQGRGMYALRFLAKIYQNMDYNKQLKLSLNDFKWGLISANIYLDNREYQFLQKQFGSDGVIDYLAFLNQLRGLVKQNRKQMIKVSYETIKKRLGDNITVEELGKMYDAKRHPQVVKGRRQEQAAFNQFVAHFNHVQPDYLVKYQQFEEYYIDISATIPKDNHFEFLLVSVWHL